MWILTNNSSAVASKTAAPIFLFAAVIGDGQISMVEQVVLILPSLTL